MIRTLQGKLTWSHLIVTIVSVVFLELLVFFGYMAYLRTDWVAAWAGDAAAYYADDLVWWLSGDALDAELAAEFVFDQGFATVDDEEFINDLIVIVDANSRLVATNNPQLHLGADANTLAHFDATLTDPDVVGFALADEDTHIGQAPVIDDQGQLLGWVYFQAKFVLGGPFTSEETARGLIVGLLAATLIAVVVSLIVGSWLARSFSRRLEQLSQTAVQLANGRLQERAVVDGDDEIAELGTRFNQMAGQLEKQVHQLRELADKNALLAEEARSLAALEERNRLARELHDAVKQQVFGLSLLAGSIRPLLLKNPDKATERLQLLEKQARDVHVEMDNIIQELRPASLSDRGLGEVLGEWVDGWSARTDIQAKVTVANAYELPLAVEQTLYRVAQEALHNVEKHAQATAVQVRLHYDLDAVLLQVIDNGNGFDATATQPSRAFGLRSMAQRMEEINGRFHIRSQPAEGTIVEAEVGVAKRLKGIQQVKTPANPF